MRRTPEQDRVGRWMRYAARRARLTAPEIKKSLGLKTAVTIYRWWGGERAPTAQTLAAYGRVVGQPVEYFHQADEPPELSRTRVEGVAKIADLILRGVDEKTAFDAVERGRVGPERLGGLGLPESREALRELITAVTGKDLGLLTARERQQLLWELAEVVVAHHPPADAGAQPHPTPGE
jgi:hypothetical protein